MFLFSRDSSSYKYITDFNKCEVFWCTHTCARTLNIPFLRNREGMRKEGEKKGRRVRHGPCFAIRIMPSSCPEE